MLKDLKKSYKKTIGFALVLTMLFSMCIVANAETTLTASDTVDKAAVSLSHKYSWASVTSRGKFDSNHQGGVMDITVSATLKNSKNGNISYPNNFSAGKGDVTCSYSRPSGSYTITHSRSTYIYSFGGKTKSKALGA